MSIRYQRILLAMVLMVGSCSLLYSQSVLTPQELTNRPLALPNDASAVGWNPSLLGTRTDTHDFLLALPFGISHTFTGTPFALFAKYGPGGIGMISGHDDSLNPYAHYYAAFGWPAIQGRFWVGGGFRLLNEAGAIHGGGVTVSATIRPSSKLMASLSLIDPTGGASANFSATYALNDDLTLLLSALYDKVDTQSVQSNFRPSIGASLTPTEMLNLTAMVDPVNTRVRIGAEFNMAGIGIGTIGAWSSGAGVTDGIAYAHYSTDRSRPNSDASYGVPAPIVRSASILGWAPDRAFAPVGIQFGRQSIDATKSPGSLVLPCTPEQQRTFDNAEQLVNAITSTGGDYAALSQRLQTLSPDAGHLYGAIRQEYYSPPIHDTELSSNDTLAIISRQGYAIGVQHVDYNAFPHVVVTMQVANAQGRNVRGLGVDDFSFRDTSRKVLSVQPIDARRNVPVDIVLMLDCSGSMTQKIAAVRENVQNFVNNIESRGANYRIGGVLYGSVIYDTLSPTSDFAQFRTFVSRAEAIGGDEISSLAIRVASDMDFRPNAQKIFVLITDDWAVQNNANLTEADLTDMLWRTGARLYTISNPCRNNSSVLTRLTLGAEYDIQSPFNTILDDLGTDITTVYQLVYESKAPAPPSLAVISGMVRDYRDRPVMARIELRDSTQTLLQTLHSDKTTGEYRLEIEPGQKYTLTVQNEAFSPQTETIDLRNIRQPPTLRRDIVFPRPTTLLAGTVRDEQGRPAEATIRVENATTLNAVAAGNSDSSGAFEIPLLPGSVYRITAQRKDHIPTPVEIDTRHIASGAKIRRDLRITSIDAAIASGTAFALKNIFFDFDKWDLRPESIPELNKLVTLLSDYPAMNVEIGAHTDAMGTDEYNITLSENRAQSVVDYLVHSGIASARLHWRGYGKTMPVATNDTEEGRQLNRRVEFKVVK